jgi:hypothetical protein
MVLDDWGVLDVVLSNGAGLPEAAAAIHRLVGRWNVPHHRITYDKLGIGRNFPAHLARYGITTAVPYAREGRPRDPNTFINLRTEAAWKLRNRLDPSHPPFAAMGPGGWAVPGSMTQQAFYVLPWRLPGPPGRRAAALDIQPGRQEDQAHAQGRVGDDPGPFARRGGCADPEHDPGFMKVSTPSPLGFGQPPY